MSVVVSFPSGFKCPSCNRSVSEEDLSECLTCGQKYCSSKECDWSCGCDRVAADIALRMSEMGTRRRKRGSLGQKIVALISKRMGA